MFARRFCYRVTTALTACGLIFAPVQSGWAQMYTPGPPGAAPGTAPAITPLPGAIPTQVGPTQVGPTQVGDPPARVGRLGFVQGTVSFHTADETQWQPATLNYPVSSGNAFWTEPTALARLEVDASTLWLDGGTEFDVNTLDLHTLQATQPQGEVYLHLRSQAPADRMVVQTPRGVVTLQGNGRYAIAAGDTDHPTEVTVLDGTAQISGQNLSLAVRAGQAATITGTQNFQGVIGPAQQDSFLAAMLRREQPPAPAVVAQAQAVPLSAPVIVQQMTGSDDLDQYGAWQDAPQYGRVWYPQVESDWVPYRHGHWAFVAPWGWTWVDDAPWGFAPFHYGRWVQVNDRWGWTPQAEGPDYRGGYGPPVYAPALVTFFGLGAAAAIGIGAAAAFSHGNVGWVPLGPREPYYPPYRVSDGYLRRVNGPGITNINNSRQNNTNITINNFANRGAATFVPEDAMARSRPIAAARANVPQSDVGQFRSVAGRPVIAPTPATVGVTPTVAREMRFSAPPERQASPGPSVNPAVFQAAPGRPGAAPPLRGLPANIPSQAQPGSPGVVPGSPRLDGQRPEGQRPEGQPGQINPPGQPGLRSGEARPNAAPGPSFVPREANPQTQAGPSGQIRPGEPRPEAAPGLPALRPSGPQGEVRPNIAAPAPQVNGQTGARPQEQSPGLRPPAQLQRPVGPEPARPVVPPQQTGPQPVAPRVETPRVEAPRVETPRVEAPRPVAPAARPEPPRQAPPPPRPEPPHVAPPVSRPEPQRLEPPRPEPARQPPPPAPRPEPPRPAPPPAPRPEPPRAEPPRPEPPRAPPPAPRPAPPPPHHDDKRPQ